MLTGSAARVSDCCAVGEWWAAGGLPDRILIFRSPTLAICENEQQVAEEVRITVRPEVAHHFGIDDAPARARLELTRSQV